VAASLPGDGPGCDVLPGNLLISDWRSRNALGISERPDPFWQYDQTSPVLKPVNPDLRVLHSRSGSQIVISEEGNARIDVLTVKNKQIGLHYGHYGQQGAGKNYLSEPLERARGGQRDSDPATSATVASCFREAAAP